MLARGNASQEGERRHRAREAEPFGTHQKQPQATTASALAVAGPVAAASGAELFKAKGCESCLAPMRRSWAPGADVVAYATLARPGVAERRCGAMYSGVRAFGNL